MTCLSHRPVRVETCVLGPLTSIKKTWVRHCFENGHAGLAGTKSVKLRTYSTSAYVQMRKYERMGALDPEPTLKGCSMASSDRSTARAARPSRELRSFRAGSDGLWLKQRSCTTDGTSTAMENRASAVINRRKGRAVSGQLHIEKAYIQPFECIGEFVEETNAGDVCVGLLEGRVERV